MNFRSGHYWPRLRASFGMLCAANIAVFCCLGPALQGQQAKPTEYQVKAAYLYNFSRFVKWPAGGASKAEPFTICVLGTDPFGPALDAVLSSADAGGRRFVDKRLSKPEDAVKCQIVFVADSEEDHLKDILDVLNNTSVLTVSDIPQFLERGGMIEFVLQGDKVRFEVDLKNAEEAGLDLSAELLKVALKVTNRQGV